MRSCPQQAPNEPKSLKNQPKYVTRCNTPHAAQALANARVAGTSQAARLRPFELFEGLPNA